MGFSFNDKIHVSLISECCTVECCEMMTISGPFILYTCHWIRG